MFTTLASSIPNEAIPIIAIGGGLVVAVVAIITGTIKSIATTRSREQTKREVAAYVAEGTIRPEDAERIINAGRKSWEKC